MEFNEIMTIITNNGFAIVVAMYSLTRLERTMKENTEVMREVLLTIRKGD